jgi:predicted ATP-dependent serine protease
LKAVPVEVQVMVAPGKVVMQIVGLPDKAVAESRERVHAALHASGLALPAKKVTVNLAPADLPKEGSHFDLPIALGLMAALGAIPADALAGYVVIGELNLDGTIAAVAGALPAAIGANAMGKGLICPPTAARGRLGRRRSRHSRTAQPDRARQPFSRHAGAVAAGAGRSAPSAPTCPILPTSRARRAPSGRWKWLPPAAITC